MVASRDYNGKGNKSDEQLPIEKIKRTKDSEQEIEKHIILGGGRGSIDGGMGMKGSNK